MSAMEKAFKEKLAMEEAQAAQEREESKKKAAWFQSLARHQRKGAKARSAEMLAAEMEAEKRWIVNGVAAGKLSVGERC